MDTKPDRVRAIAESLDCLLEEDLAALAAITPGTAESWRKRGKGPAHVRIGNTVLYPRTAVAAYLKTMVRERPDPDAKAQL